MQCTTLTPKCIETLQPLRAVSAVICRLSSIRLCSFFLCVLLLLFHVQKKIRERERGPSIYICIQLTVVFCKQLVCGTSHVVDSLFANLSFVLFHFFLFFSCDFHFIFLIFCSFVCNVQMFNAHLTVLVSNRTYDHWSRLKCVDILRSSFISPFFGAQFLLNTHTQNNTE